MAVRVLAFRSTFGDELNDGISSLASTSSEAKNKKGRYVLQLRRRERYSFKVIIVRKKK